MFFIRIRGLYHHKDFFNILETPRHSSGETAWVLNCQDLRAWRVCIWPLGGRQWPVRQRHVRMGHCATACLEAISPSAPYTIIWSPPHPMWNMFIVLCVKQAYRPSPPPHSPPAPRTFLGPLVITTLHGQFSYQGVYTNLTSSRYFGDTKGGNLKAIKKQTGRRNFGTPFDGDGEHGHACGDQSLGSPRHSFPGPHFYFIAGKAWK